jgi:hypothetical protein
MKNNTNCLQGFASDQLFPVSINSASLFNRDYTKSKQWSVEQLLFIV